ncbi:HEXXH motif domain-containing protein [Actinophytocola sp. KF-1]
MNNQDFPEDARFHRMSWADFDEVARGQTGPGVVRRLRHAERSRRLLLLRALVDEVCKKPELYTPLPSPEEAWDLLARVDAKDPDAFDHVLAHPYVGSWAGYTIRLLRKGITGVCPLWAHVGHLHSVAAAAAIRAGLDFHVLVPVWGGGVNLPTLGLARLPADEPHSVAAVRGTRDHVEIAHESGRVVLTAPFGDDAPGWWGVRQLAMSTGRHRLTLRLDDVDHYRGLHEPTLPRRLDATEVDAWRRLLAGAWDLVCRHLPERAGTFSAGLDSLVPVRAVRFQTMSASSGEAFGSAVIAEPDDSVTLGATLVHEFHHIVLGGVLHLARLQEEDRRERFYVPWRPDPRPLSGALQGIYAFFGVTEFWRAIAYAPASDLTRRAMFEFAQARSETWRVLQAVRADGGLTREGRRFLDGIAGRLGPWLDEPVPEDLRRLAESVTADHHAGWRMRHLRPDSAAVAALTEAWLAGQPHAPVALPQTDPEPTPVADGTPSLARTDLIRLGITTGDRRAAGASWRSVRNATTADLAYANGRFADAAQEYRAELAKDPDRVSAWVGLGLALSAVGTGPAARALTRHPELVRAVRRRIATTAQDVPAPERLATWIGQGMY